MGSTPLVQDKDFYPVNKCTYYLYTICIVLDGEAAKVLFLMAVPLRPYPPPSSLGNPGKLF